MDQDFLKLYTELQIENCCKHQGDHPVYRIGISQQCGSLTTNVSTSINAEDLTLKVVISNNSFRFFKPGH
jgi:hypothetical protein